MAIQSNIHILTLNSHSLNNSEFPINYVARYGYVWRPGLQRGLSMLGNPPTVLRHFTTPKGKYRCTVDYVGNRKVRINFLNKFCVDLTSMLLTAILLAALWLLFALELVWWRPSREAHHVIKTLTLQTQFSYQKTELFSLFLCIIHSYICCKILIVVITAGKLVYQIVVQYSHSGRYDKILLDGHKMKKAPFVDL